MSKAVETKLRSCCACQAVTNFEKPEPLPLPIAPWCEIQYLEQTHKNMLCCNSFVMTYVGVKCLTRHCSVLRDTRTRGTT